MAGNLGRLAANAVSMLTSQSVNRATTFVMYVLVGRHLGAYEFGQMSLALTLFYLAQVFAIAGLKTLIAREVARDRSKTDSYLVNGSAVVVIASALSLGLLWLFVRLMGYSADTAAIILLLSLGLLPYSLSAVSEATFQAWERMHFIAYANVGANVAKVGLAFLLLARGYGLYHLVGLILLSHLAVLLVEWFFIARQITRPRIAVEPALILALARATSTFLGIEAIIAVLGSINVILLSKLASEVEVGYFSAAAQLVAPMVLFYQGIALSLFPVMSRRFEPTFEGLNSIARKLVGFLMAVALPVVIGLFFMADSVLTLLYGERGFTISADVLRVLVWTLPLTAITFALGNVLLASRRERTTLRIVAVDLAITLVVGPILISLWGVMGAAATVLIMRVVDVVQHYVLVTTLLRGFSLPRLLWRQVAAGGCMALSLAALSDQGILLQAVSGGMVYGGVLGILGVWWLGGVGRIRSRLQYRRSQ